MRIKRGFRLNLLLIKFPYFSFQPTRVNTFLTLDVRYSEISDSDDGYKIAESFVERGRESERDTQINMEWENIVREATQRKQKKTITEDIGERESQFFEFIHNKRSKIRETTKKYIRNQKGRKDDDDFDKNSNFGTHFMIQSFLNPDPSEEKKEARKILQIELILVILKLKNIHKNIISDFEQNRCRRYLLDFVEKNPNCEEAHFGLSQIYFSLGIYDKALTHVDKGTVLSNL
jgi:hypothetical protein